MTTTVKNYFSLVKFAHTIFAMPFAMIGFSLGIAAVPAIETKTWIMKLVLVLVCMVTARNAAMGFNRYLDRDIDIKNPRTATRDIPAGKISPKNALNFVIVNCILFIIATAFINPNHICLFLSPIALFVILFYSYTKRFTPLCHLVLGLGLSLAPLGAYLAVTDHFALLPIFFSLAVITWVSGFDVIYAMQDTDFDQSESLYSIPSRLGKVNALRVSSLLHFFTTVFVISAGVYGSFHLLFWIGAAIFIGMLIYQHALVKPNDLSKVNIAFMTANGIASIVFGALVILDIFIFK